MLVLTENDKAVDLDQVGASKQALHYCVLDISKPKDPDYFFRPLAFINTWTAPSALFTIGPFSVMLPFRWSMVVMDTDTVELIPMEDLTSGQHEAFSINPLSGYMPNRYAVRYSGAYEISWTCPELLKTELLVLPITNGSKPKCVIVGEVTKFDNIDPGALW